MDKTERKDEPDLVMDICPDGDVILIVGPQNVRLKVHSQCLRCASTVFGAMLGPHWSKGQELSKESPREVALAEDDANALEIICCVIHHRNDDVPESLTPKEVLQIAIVADKYDLNCALKYASVEWLKPRGDAGKADMGRLLAAAFLYGDMNIFVAHTLVLILHYNGSYLKFLDDELVSQIVPWKTFYLLEEHRNQMRAELSQLLIDGKHADCSCGWGKTRSQKYALLISEYGPLRMLEVPIFDIITKIEKVSHEDIERIYHSTNFHGYYHEVSDHSEKVAGKLEKMKRKASICLDCVRTNEDAAPCEFQHE